MRVHDRLSLRAAVYGHMHGRLARRALVLARGFPIRFDPDQIPGAEKAQRAVLPGDQKLMFALATAQIAAPAANQAPLKEQPAAAYYFAFELRHQRSFN